MKRSVPTAHAKKKAGSANSSTTTPSTAHQRKRASSLPKGHVVGGKQGQTASASSSATDDLIICACGSIAAVGGITITFVLLLLALSHVNEGFGAAITETIVKQMMPRVNVTVVVGHGRHSLLVDDDAAGTNGNTGDDHQQVDDPNYLSPRHRSQLVHKDTNALLGAALDHLDAIEVKGHANFETMHVLGDSHEGITAEWAQRVRDGKLMCEWLGRLVEAHEELSTNSDGDNKDDDATALVLELCDRKQTSTTTKSVWTAKTTAYRHFYFHRPSVTKYGAHQWLWDSCFHIMAQVAAWRGTISSNGVEGTEKKDGQEEGYMRHISTQAEVTINGGNDEVVKGAATTAISRRSPLYRLIAAILEFRSLMLFQNLETGFVPEMTYWHPDPNQYFVAGYLFGYGDKGKRFTDITQMPMLSFPLQRIVRAMRDVEAALAEKRGGGGTPTPTKSSNGVVNNKKNKPLHKLALAYFSPKVALYYKYWLDARYRDGLVSIIHPWESGLDASPMYDPFHDFCKDKLAAVAEEERKKRAATQHIADEKKLPEYMRGVEKTTTRRAASASSSTAAPKRTWYSTFMAIVDPTTADCPPHPEDLYPKFISLLYRYRHADGWDLKAILGDGMGLMSGTDASIQQKEKTSSGSTTGQPNRFEVQDVGVNAVLGYNMKLVLEMLDEAVEEKEDNEVPTHADGSVHEDAATTASKHHEYHHHSDITTGDKGTPSRHHDSAHRFLADDIVLPNYEELFGSGASNTDGAPSSSSDDSTLTKKGKRIWNMLRYGHLADESVAKRATNDDAPQPHPIAFSHKIADGYIRSIVDHCVSTAAAGTGDDTAVSIEAITSRGWSPREQAFIKTDATRVVQQLMLLLVLSPTANDIDGVLPTPDPTFTSTEKALAKHLVDELSDSGRFGSEELVSLAEAHAASVTSADDGKVTDDGPNYMRKHLVSYTRLLKRLAKDLHRYDATADPLTAKSGEQTTGTTFIWGTPTTAVNDLAFVAEDSALMWRGPSWPTTNWYVMEGLGELAERLRMVEEKERKQAKANNAKSSSTTATNNTRLTSAYVANLRANLLRSWTVLVHASGFSEYYNPLSGEPLGQRGLGMSLSLLDALWGRH